jgi:hypothetical protein
VGVSDGVGVDVALGVSVAVPVAVDVSLGLGVSVAVSLAGGKVGVSAVSPGWQAAKSPAISAVMRKAKDLY